ncbi:hypothetical protein SESBI_11263 [Sesbania bispinosa]|nr:hypothetical protein SESBI_11263 [Sesbania bispinosa]
MTVRMSVSRWWCEAELLTQGNSGVTRKPTDVYAQRAQAAVKTECKRLVRTVDGGPDDERWKLWRLLGVVWKGSCKQNGGGDSGAVIDL